MDTRIKAVVLQNGAVVAESTINVVDLKAPGSHTFDLVAPGEDPDSTSTSYQLTIYLDPIETAPAPLTATASRLTL